MNIFEMYNMYRGQHTTEFKRILEEVAKEVLLLTEQIPEDIARKNFVTNCDRRYLICSRNVLNPAKIKEGCMIVSFGGGESIGQFAYNDVATKKLDEFMEIYYPGIICTKGYVLDLYSREIEFHFEFNVEYSDDDFEWLGDLGVLKKGKTDITTSMELFTDDIAEILNREFTYKDWEELEKYEKVEKQRVMHSNVYMFGSVFVKIAI